MTNLKPEVFNGLLLATIERYQYDEVASMTNEEIVAVLEDEGVEAPKEVLMIYVPHIRRSCHEMCFTDPDDLY